MQPVTAGVREERPTKEYFHDLDIARGVLMALGVVLHTANIYAVGGADGTLNTDRSLFFTHINDAIHLFRMPAFFMISGFFCVMSLTRYGPSKLLRVRSVRLLVPFAATFLTLNLVEYWLLAKYGALDGALSFSKVFFTEALVFHLWFLLVLFVHCAAAAGVFFAFARSVRLVNVCRRAIDTADSVDFLWLTPLLALLAFAPHAAGALAPGLVYANAPFGQRLFVIIEYAPYFAFGAFLYYARRNLDRLRLFSWTKAAGFLAAAILIPVLFINFHVSGLAAIWLSGFGGWFLALTIFGVFAGLTERFALRPKNVGDTTYTIYLTHHVLVTLLGIVFVGVVLPIGVEFLMIVIATTAITYAIHVGAVRPSRTLSMLFNGKRLSRTAS